MRLKDIGLSFAAAVFVTGPLAATAQDDPEGEINQCRSLSSASRTRANACGDDDDTSVQSAEKELTLRISLDRPTIDLAQCQANLALDYVQIDSLASVSGVIENEDCAASGGEYTIQARIRDENGETSTLDFPESWQRDDDQPVKFSAEYPIGANVELVRVRSRGLSCECAEPLEESEPAPVQ
jgi:hypothetical protein